jgi:CRISPR-associated endonuclease/helicase Cas3
LPDRWRHEADSVRRALAHPRFSGAHDPHLVLWLIGTHHGYGRPLFPHADSLHAGPQDLDFQFQNEDWPQMFSLLLRRYGPWELARLEAIVRLADHRASEDEENEGTAHHDC